MTEKQNKILIVDDEENILWVLKKGLEKKDYLVHTASSGQDALKRLAGNQYLMMFSDIFMEETNGLQLLEQTRKVSPDLKVVMMTAQDTMNNTIEAMRLGAYDYITKPFDFDEIFRLIDQAETAQSISAPTSTLSAQNQEAGSQNTSTTSAIIGKSKRMQEIFKTRECFSRHPRSGFYSAFLSCFYLIISAGWEETLAPWCPNLFRR